jgi:hypothetical protein
MALLVATAVTTAAAETKQNPTTGQPGFNCANGQTPGNAASASGSAFNQSGTAGTRYAGNGAGSVQHSNSTAAVSQYDVACR